ncbi:MAG: glycosyltransferase [Gammaproteobacteria bacterium]|nr:glycosyltransferase [Gammaproteobacteria bacterium]
MTPIPVLSTIVLNWNRRDLLERTLRSYLATVSVPYELIVVDNGSTDDSLSLLAHIREQHPHVHVILLENNEGGEAINKGIEASQGDLIHISENDIEYLQGWTEKVLSAFAAFPRLGQLSLFGPVPSDEEIWEIKPCALLHSKGRVIYEAAGNVGTTCVIPRTVWMQGIRISSIRDEKGTVLFPDDGKLSGEIKQLGYLIAWSDHYLVKNLGHTLEEFQKRLDYYRQGYEAKAWLGQEGWANRIAQWESTPKPDRSSRLFPGHKISPEKSTARPDCPQPQLWSMFDGWTGEMETIEFLHALVRLAKPGYCVETGTWLGYSSEAIGLALRQNGQGTLDTIEYDPQVATATRERLASLADIVEVHNCSSLEFTPRHPIDFLLLDSALTIRIEEFERYRRHLKPSALVIFHDTRINNYQLEHMAMPYIKGGILSAISLAIPRGLLLCQYKALPFHGLRLFLGKLRLKLLNAYARFVR